MKTKQRSILAAIAVLAAVALFGAAVGAFADRSLRAAPAPVAEVEAADCPAPRCDRAHRGMRTRMIDRLDLSADQQERLDRVLEAGHAEIRSIRDESGERMNSVVADLRREIDAVLTDEQRERLKQMRQERRQRGSAGETREAPRPYGSSERTSPSPQRDEQE